jgi:hypothetical protein
VTTEFMRALREIVAARGKPTWTTMLSADPATAPPVYHQLVAQAFTAVEEKIRAAGRVPLLHDATPLARYKGGPELLSRLADAARDPHESPHGLWLLCPMQDPKALPLLDDVVVQTNTSNERLVLPSTFGQPDEMSTGRAS